MYRTITLKFYLKDELLGTAFKTSRVFVSNPCSPSQHSRLSQLLIALGTAILFCSERKSSFSPIRYN
jgi:hypothetical protein